jgi:hypothetical protein
MGPVNFRYDQMLFEDETKNRMTETKELFDWVLKQRCFEVRITFISSTFCFVSHVNFYSF